MKTSNVLSKTSVRELKNDLASRITSHFIRGDIGFSSVWDDNKSDFPEGNVSLTTPFGHIESDLEGLTAADINLEQDLKEDYYSSMLKQSQYTIDETIDIPLKNLLYPLVRLPIKESSLGRKKFRILYSASPVTAVLNGSPKPVAKLRIDLLLEEKSFLDLCEHYKRDTNESFLQLHVAGPALLHGGKTTAVVGRQWLEYFLKVFVTDYQVIGITSRE